MFDTVKLIVILPKIDLKIILHNKYFAIITEKWYFSQNITLNEK